MRRSTLILSVALLASACASLWLWNQLNDQRLLSRGLQSRLDALEHYPGTSTVATRPKDASPSPVSRTTNTVVPVSTIPMTTSSSSDYDEIQRRAFRSPEYRKAYRNQQRAWIEFAFRDLPKALGLSPDMADRVFDLMADNALHNAELGWQPAEAAGDRRPTREEQQRLDDARLTQLLGDATMRRLQNFRETLASHNEVNNLRSNLMNATEPLRDDQVEPLVAVVYAEKQRYAQEIEDSRATPADGGIEYEKRMTELLNASHQRMLESARPILSSTQFAALTDYYRNQRAMSEAMAEVHRAQFEADRRDAQSSKEN